MTHPRATVRGFEVVDLGSSESFELFRKKVSDALQLIEKYEPARFVRISRDLKRLALIVAGGEFYHRGLNAYFADAPTMRARSVDELAAAIVHEATHARLARRGISTTANNQSRIEGICTEAAASFADRLPNGADLAEHLRRTLSTPWWTERAVRERKVEQLKASGVPRILVKASRRLFMR